MKRSIITSLINWFKPTVVTIKWDKKLINHYVWSEREAMNWVRQYPNGLGCKVYIRSNLSGFVRVVRIDG
jgi:hypothetical protein